MSRNVKSVNVSVPIKKYCKVCHDSGKSEADYTSHFIRETRETNSKIICPTLLALECRYCYKNGHTVKYCPVLKENERKRNSNEASAIRNESLKNNEIKDKKISNLFNYLDCDEMILDNSLDSHLDSHLDSQYDTDKFYFPALLSSSHTQPQLVLDNYAAALSKPAAEPKPAAQLKPVVMTVNVPVVVSAKPEANIATWSSISKKGYDINKSWADYGSESEDEDEDEDW